MPVSISNEGQNNDVKIALIEESSMVVNIWTVEIYWDSLSHYWTAEGEIHYENETDYSGKESNVDYVVLDYVDVKIPRNHEVVKEIEKIVAMVEKRAVRKISTKVKNDIEILEIKD